MKKSSDVVDNEVVKNTKFNALKTKVNSSEKKIPDATTLIHVNQYNTDKENLDKKIRDVDNKIPDTSNLVATTALNTIISGVENKVPDNSKYITTQKFNKLTPENFASRLKQADLVNKTDFDKKLTSFNRGITSNKAKHLEVQKKLDSLITKDYIFFLDRIYFTSNNGSQNTFVYQPALDTLKLKKK